MTKGIAVTMPNNTVYVNGTVNGVEYVFTLTGSSAEGTVWTADVARAVPDVYVCKITATASTGTTATVEVTLYYGLQGMITDRTQEDVDYVMKLASKGIAGMTADELIAWNEGLKGAYNATDLNRVESAVQYIIDRFAIAGVFPKLHVKTTWSRDNYPNQSEMERYLDNIRVLRSVLPMASDVPEVPFDMHLLTYQEANDIEKILLVIDDVITKISKIWFYSNEIYAGEVH